MSILLLEALNIKKSYSDKLLLDIKAFRVYAGNRIGFVGSNGSGKSTFLNILSGDLEPDDGIIRRYCDIGYVRQFENQSDSWAGEPPVSDINAINEHETGTRKLSEYGVLNKTQSKTVSGGEAARLKIAYALSNDRRLLLNL